MDEAIEVGLSGGVSPVQHCKEDRIRIPGSSPVSRGKTCICLRGLPNIEILTTSSIFVIIVHAN